MAFSVIITLTFGSEAGPFDLYSDVDGYVTPFVTGVPAGSFTFGYYTTIVPDGTTIIRVKSEGECINYVDLPIADLPLPSQTPSVTPTNTATPSLTPTNTPSQTPTLTPSPTCGTFTTQYLKSELQGSNSIKFTLYNDPGYTSNANAVCDYTISGTYDIDGGSINNYYSTIMSSGDHTHTYSPGPNMTAFTIASITYACPCVDVITSFVTPTPSPTATQTQTPTVTQTPSQTATNTPTPSETSPGGQLFVYARYINSSQEFGYSLNGASYLGIGEPSSSSCLYMATISGLQNGDSVVFQTIGYCSINGDTADCPNSTTACFYTHNFVGTTSVYITVDASQCC